MNNRNSIRIRISNNNDGEQIFKTIITHPMETGFRKSRKTGERIPADYIENFLINIDGQNYFEMTLGPNVSKNPYIACSFTSPLTDVHLMIISWVDNNNREASYDCIVDMSEKESYSFNRDIAGSDVISEIPD